MNSRIIDATQLGPALHALARQEVKALHEALDNQRARHRGVHEARKAIRRLRSLLLLGRTGFGAAGERLDAKLKHLATSLSALRDAHVVVETAGGMLRGARGEKMRKRWTALRRQLSNRRKQVLDDALAGDPGFEQRRGDVVRHAATIDRLPWDALEHDTLRRELERSLRRLRKAERHASRPDADIEQRHRWRRRLRRLRMQWSALKTLHKRTSDTGVRADSHALLAWLRSEAPRFAQVATSADALGADQDLVLLQAAIGQLPPSHGRDLALQDIEATRAAVRA
jgi:CHAD domain-containing protein